MEQDLCSGRGVGKDHGQRWKGMEIYRIGKGGLAHHLGFAPETKFAEDGLGRGPYKTLDAEASVNNHIHAIRDSKDRLFAATEAYKVPENISNH